jgi:hypothetical protein
VVGRLAVWRLAAIKVRGEFHRALLLVGQIP